MPVSRFKELSKELDQSADVKSSYALYFIIAFISVFLLWATRAELDSVTSGSGKIISSLQNQIVQASTSGVIIERYVREDQLVKRGDKLIDIDPVDVAAELVQLELKLAAITVKELRLNAELGGTDLIIPSDLKRKVPAASVTEESIFFGNAAKLSSQRIILEQRLEQKKQDFKAAMSAEKAKEKTINLLQNQLDLVEPLVEEKLAPQVNLLNLLKDLEKEIAGLEAARIQRDRANFAIAEIVQELESLLDKFHLETVEELNSLVSRKLELEQKIPTFLESVSRKTVRAPMDGIVKKLNYNTIGGYVSAGNEILELVPTGDDLMMEGSIASRDISTIKVGDEVRIRLSAYDSIRFGTMQGEVSSISPDSVTNSQTGVAAYPIDVKFTDLLMSGEVEVQLIPGMTAEIDVLTGKRTVFEYLWYPVARINERALRD